MLRLLADENFNGYIVRGLLRRRAGIDLVRVQDVGLIEQNDQDILEWAGVNNYILVTHDRATIPNFAYERVRVGKPMPGVFVFNDKISLRDAIDELLFLDEFSQQDDWYHLVTFLPL